MQTILECIKIITEYREKIEMKKLLFVLIVIIVLATGCNQGVAPTQAPAEPAFPEEEPTQIPTPTEGPTDIPVPTDEPTATPTLEPTPTPTEEPTPEPLPDRCPLEGFDIEMPEIVDFGEYGMYQVGQTSIRNDDTKYLSFFLAPGKPGLDEGLNRIMYDGGEFTFTMPSIGVMFLLVDETEVKVNGEEWNPLEGKGTVIVSPEGKIILPAESTVEVITKGGIEKDTPVFVIRFLSGRQIESEEIQQPEMSFLACNELWQLTIKNSSEQDITIPLEMGKALILKDFEGLLNMADSFGDIPSEYIIKGINLFSGYSITIRKGGFVELLILDLYPYSQD